MAHALKVRKLIWDCEKGIAASLPPESGITEHQAVQRLLTRPAGERGAR
jgi:hypothetical protein